jgi:hypothetical protein
MRRGLFCFEKLQSARRLIPTPVAWGVAERAAVRTFEIISAGTRERAGARRGAEATAASGPAAGIRFAPEMIALPRSAAHFVPRRGR